MTTVLGVWIAAILTLAIFSFLYRDNPFYKFAEHLIVGVSAGYWTVILYKTSLTDLLLTPLAEDFAGGRLFGSPSGFLSFFYHAFPMVLGVFMLCRLHPKSAWLSRISIAFIIGSGAGVAIPTGLQTAVIQPLRGTLLPILPSSWQAWLHGLFGDPTAAVPGMGWWAAFNNLLIVLGVLCALFYFFFSVEHKGFANKAANFGIWVLMIGFGSTFGFTVMSRVSLLVGRFEFLINTWVRENFLGLFG